MKRDSIQPSAISRQLQTDSCELTAKESHYTIRRTT
jgi:hypothetical protein